MGIVVNTVQKIRKFTSIEFFLGALVIRSAYDQDCDVVKDKEGERGRKREIFLVPMLGHDVRFRSLVISLG